jgi:hypothetical protein
VVLLLVAAPPLAVAAVLVDAAPPLAVVLEVADRHFLLPRLVLEAAAPLLLVEKVKVLVERKEIPERKEITTDHITLERREKVKVVVVVGADAMVEGAVEDADVKLTTLSK